MLSHLSLCRPRAACLIAVLASASLGCRLTESPGAADLQCRAPLSCSEAPVCSDGRWERSRRFLRGEVSDLIETVPDDARAIANRRNLLWAGGALAAALVLRQDLDGEVRATTARHPERWGSTTHALGVLGEAQYQVPVLLGVRALAVRSGDRRRLQFSRALMNAYTINGLGTLAFKAATNTDRPTNEWNGGHFGFPSFHASSSFTVAAVVHEFYGGVPATGLYLASGLIGWSRLDERDHDLSDVVFGAAWGYLVGRTVAAHHRTGDARIRLSPFHASEQPALGLQLEIDY